MVLLALIMLGLAAGERYRMLQKWRRLRAPGSVELMRWGASRWREPRRISVGGIRNTR
jgi:hypothetical protein